SFRRLAGIRPSSQGEPFCSFISALLTANACQGISTDTMPDFAGIWKMKSSENFDELLKALGVNAMLRKVAVAAASKPHVEIRQNGDQFYIKTSTTVRTTEIQFTVGEEFDEETVDGRKCKSFPIWEKEKKIYCKQTLVDGTGPKTFWTRELAGDELILVRKFTLICEACFTLMWCGIHSKFTVSKSHFVHADRCGCQCQ
ncbi:unnamed protein product, partial [Staurois parvus]